MRYCRMYVSLFHHKKLLQTIGHRQKSRDAIFLMACKRSVIIIMIHFSQIINKIKPNK